MVFAKRLREGVVRGEITSSIRIWTSPHVKAGNRYRMGDGEIEPTFRWRQQLQGAHAGEDEHNKHGIGIAVVGNFDLGPPSPAQIASVRRLIRVLRVRYGIEISNIIRHSDIKATACPGKYFPMDEIAQGRTDPLLGATRPRDEHLHLAVTPTDGRLPAVATPTDDRLSVVAKPTVDRSGVAVESGGGLLPVAAEERNHP